MIDLASGGLEFAFDGPRPIVDCVERLGSIDRADWGRSIAAEDGEAAAAKSPPRVRVDCQLHADASADAADAAGPRRRWLEWQWGTDSCLVFAREVRAQVWRRAGGYAVKASVSADHNALRRLVTALASAILHDLGGAIQHAASIEIDGAVVAFIGPSGAGKSTACGHVEGARLFSVDRLAILPCCPGLGTDRAATVGSAAPGKAAWLAYPIPGGTLPDFDIPRANASWLPLAAVFRVHQASHGAWLEACSLPSAVAVLRESAFHAGSGPGPELELLSRLERLARSLRIARLHLSLGSTLAPVLRRWLEEQR